MKTKISSLLLLLFVFSVKAAELSVYNDALSKVKNSQAQEIQKNKPITELKKFKERFDQLTPSTKRTFYIFLALYIDRTKLDLSNKLTTQLKNEIEEKAWRITGLDRCLVSCQILYSLFREYSYNNDDKYEFLKFALELKKAIEKDIFIQSKL